MAVEDEFGIDIADADAADLTTPRALADYVSDRIGAADAAERCLSRAAFHRIRSVLSRQFGVARARVRPDAPIRDFLGDDVRRQWRALLAAVDAGQVPGLKCKKRIYFPLALGLPLLAAAVLAAAEGSLWLPLLAFVLLWIVGNVVADRFADVIPEQLGTVGALVPYVRISNRQEWTRGYVLQRILQITSMQLDIPMEQIRPDHHFVKDLGAD